MSIRFALAVAFFATPIVACAEDLYVSNGDNRIITISPAGVGSIFASAGLNSPFGVAFDAVGNLYAANLNGNTIVRFTPGGVGSVFASTGVNGPKGLAFDAAGNLYVSNTNDLTIMRFTPGGVGSLFANPGLSNIYGMAFDSAGNLFVDGNNTIKKFTPAGVGSVFATTGLSNPLGMTFDHSGNLLVANAGANTILKLTPGGVGSVFANTNTSSNGAVGLALDQAGNVYSANNSTNTIEKFSPAGGSGSPFFTSGAQGFGGPLFLAFAPTLPPAATRVASFATPIPEGTGNFTSLPSAPGYSAGGVAIYGEGTGGQAGVYRMGQGLPIKVANLNTPIPTGAGNFNAFFAQGPPIIPSIDGNNVAFFGTGSGGQQGIYVSMNGQLIRVADAATAIPGGSGNFTAFTQTGVAPSPAINGSKVAFYGAGSGAQQGVYTYDHVLQPGQPIKIADTATAIPGGTGNFTAFPQHPSLSGDNVVFLGAGMGGQQGVYRAIVGPPIKVADLNTAIPGGSGNFTSFISGSPISPAINGTSVAFFGAGSGGQQGIYISINGLPIKVADTVTAIPGGTGNFTGFADFGISSTDIVFLALGAGGQQGIYDMTGGSLVKIVDRNTVLDGRAIVSFSFARVGLFGDSIAFQANFADGSHGIYTAIVPVPEPTLILATAVGGLLVGRRFIRRRKRAQAAPYGRV